MSFGETMPEYVRKAWEVGCDFLDCEDGTIWDFIGVGGDIKKHMADPKYKVGKKRNFV